ncbi:MAG: anaerobic ribonucleoside-triphosphate reductase activating protein [Candidatus Bathyarchaeota archaeon]|nr:anaerobic ribonucleoside-triphosphate reductase activating protein [Candidatus Bathyarchaeota archaeon]
MEGLDIKGYLPSSLLDYPGKIVSVVFLSGCNFRCPYCFNVEIVNNSKKLKKIEAEDIFNHLESRRKWLDGICITGGEPTLHKGLFEFISKIKQMGFLVKLDTNGTNPEVLKKLIEAKLVDYIAMDIKAPLEKYKEVTRRDVDLEKIQESIDLIRKSGVEYEFRTTVVPKFFDEKTALAIGKWLKGSKKYCIQQFRPEKTLDKGFRKEKPYLHEKLHKFAEILKPFFDNVEVRGI